MSIEVERARQAHLAGDIDEARAILRRLVDAEAPVDACCLLAGLELTQQRESAARNVLEILAAGGDLVSGPQAAVALEMLNDLPVSDPVPQGLAHEMLGALAAARANYSAASAAGDDPVRTALAKAFLGGLLSVTETEQALELLMDAVQSDVPLASSYAWLLVAPLLLEFNGAEMAGSAAWRAADADAHPAMLPWAIRFLSDMFAGSGDLDRARAAFELAVSIGHPGLLPRGYAGLFEVLAQQGDRDAMHEQYEHAVRAGRGDLVPEFACWMLGEELVIAGDLPGAEAALERIPETDPRFGGSAIAVRSLIGGDFDAARSALLRLRDQDADGHRRASQLCFQAALRLVTESGTAACRAAYEVVIESGDPEAAARALFLLGKLCNALGDRAAALTAWRDGAATGHPVFARYSATGLGVLLTVQGESAEAKSAFGQGPDYGFAMTVATDMYEAGDVDAASTAFSLVMAGDDPVQAGRAADMLTRLRTD